MLLINKLNKQYTIKRITNLRSLRSYQEKTASYIDVKFPMDYLQGSKVFAIYKNSKMVGGYSIISNKPLRVVESLKDESVKENLPANIAEITGLWMNKNVRSDYSFYLWLHMFFEIMKDQNKHFVYAYSVKKKNLENLYSSFPKKVLYRGIVEQLEGMDGEDYESIELVSKKDIYLFPFYKFSFFRKRLVKSLRTVVF
jgi:hypothetical protein